MPTIDYEQAQRELDQAGREAARLFEEGARPGVEQLFSEAAERVFSSKTASWREVLLGCVLARTVNASVNVRKPYVDPDDSLSFSGRTLDERVVNPYLVAQQIPATKGPYLATVRRSVPLTTETKRGVKDETAYEALMEALSAVERASADECRQLLRHLMWSFFDLRAKHGIQLDRVERLNLDQTLRLAQDLLNVKSGGFAALHVAASAFFAVNVAWDLGWVVDVQGINVADTASGRSGDITLRKSGEILLVVEVTERALDQQRVTATFRSKIAEQRIRDYVFLIPKVAVTSGVRDLLNRLFAQGHSVEVVDMEIWLEGVLVTIGETGRRLFAEEMRKSFMGPGTPTNLKQAWNRILGEVTEVGTL
jgi:SacI restriction endonuclease